MSELSSAIDGVLEQVTTSDPRVPGVVAVVTDRDANLYEGAAGKRVLGEDAEMTPDTVCAIFSTTKAITGTAALQLVEDGALDLDAPAKQYVPALGERQVLDGFDDDGAPRLRPPAREITTRMLLTHTAGFGYDFFNEKYLRMATEHGQPSVITASRGAIETPLLFDPGERWEYGSNIDWAGQVVEAVAGKRLGEVFAERILGPLEMGDTAFTMTDDMRSRLARIHQREADGSLTPQLELELPQDPEVHMGGHGLYSTALDYAKFIRMWLNDGAGPGGQVLKPETVRMAAENHLGELKVQPLPGVIPALSNDAEFFPGMPKSWALTFMINDEDAPTGRPAGALAWAGLANLYYWIDRANGIGGFWATQILPFADPTSVVGYLDMETAAYSALRGARSRLTDTNANPLSGGELAAFVATVEAASVHGAADALDLTQSAVTKRLQALEKRVGIALLERGRFGARPTDAGRLLYPEAKQALAALARAQDTVAEHREHAGRALQIAASHTIGEFLLPGWLSGFRAVEPDVRAQVEIVNSPGVLRAVREGDAQIGFVEGLDALDGVQARTVFRDEIAVIVGPRHRWARRRALTAASLRDEPYYTREAGSGTRAVATAALARAGIELVPAMELASTQSVKRALTDGGFSLLSPLAIDAEQRAGTLHAIAVADLDLTRELRAVHARPLRGAAKRFWAWLQAQS